MADLFDQLEAPEAKRDIFDDMDAPAGDIFDEMDRGTPESSTGNAPDVPRLRRESFKMLNDAGRLSPRIQRDVADESSGVVGGTLRGGKNVLGGFSEVLGEAISNPFTATEVSTMDDVFGAVSGGKVADDLRQARKDVGWWSSGDTGKTRETIDNFIKYFEGNGITDGREMMTILRDSVRENLWDPTSDDGARQMSDGSLRVNPKFVALPDANEGISAIQATNAPQEAKDAEIEQFKQSRKIAAKAFDQKARTYDEGYRQYAEQKAREGVTDPEQVFYSWPGLDRNWIESSWDVVRDTVAEAGRGMANTGRAIRAGANEFVGDSEEAASIGKDILASREKSQFVQDIAAARGQEGAITGTGKELGTTVLEMLPMFAGGGAGRILTGAAEAGTARSILGSITSGTSIYGYAGAQGYASMMQTALEKADQEAAQAGRELTPEEINKTISDTQGAALANGFQTAILSKLLPQGAEAVAAKGLAAEVKAITGRELLASLKREYGEQGFRAAVMSLKPELKQLARQSYEAAKVGFKDEALEEGVNQFLEGAITKMSGVDADKTWDQIGQETWKGTWMGGVVGGGLPVAREVLAKQDPAVLAARQLAARAQESAPASAQSAANTIEADGTDDSPETSGDLAPEDAPPGAAVPPVDVETAAPPAPAEVAPVAAAETQPELTNEQAQADEETGGPDQVLPGDGPLGPLDDAQSEAAEEVVVEGTGGDQGGDPAVQEPEPEATALRPTVVGPNPESAVGVAKQFKTAKEFGESLPDASGDLRQNNRTDEPFRGEFEEGKLYIDKYGENPYVYQNQWVDPREFKDRLKLEGETYETVVGMPTTQKYIEWYKSGEVPPPVSVVIREDDGKMFSTDRRRVVAALEAGVERIPARVEVGRRDDIFARATEPEDATYSPQRLKETFDLTDDEAAAADALVQAMGLDTSRINLKRGGTPGSGLENQPVQPVDVDGNPIPNAQDARGSFEKLPENSGYLLRGLTNPDFSTATHELSHVARASLLDRNVPAEERLGITDDDISAAEQWAGAKDGNWTVAAEEKFARGFERYLRDGKAPVAGLQSLFDKIGAWMANIYQTLKGGPLDVKITPEMRAVFDRLVSRNAPQAASQETNERETQTTTEEETDQAGTSTPTEGELPEIVQTSVEEDTGASSDPNLTSVKNEATDIELARYGFEPIAAKASVALQDSWDKAQARMAANPNLAPQLVTELNTKPRATDDVEHGILLKHLADAKIIYGKAQENLAKVEESGDPDAIEEARRDAEIARNTVYGIITAAKATGTVWGRAGRFRQLAIDEDYSLVQMESSYRTEVNGGEPLTAAQAKEIKELHDRIAATEKALEDFRAKAAEDTAKAVHKATLTALRKAKPKIRKALGSKIEEAKKRLREAGLTKPDADVEFLAQSALPPEVLEDLATVGAGWMVDRDPSPEEFAALLKRSFGDEVAAQAEAVRQRAREIIDSTIDEVFNPASDEPVEPKKRQPKTREDILTGLKGEELTGNDVFQLARMHIQAGVDGFENVMKAVQADLETIFPGITLREIHDAYSGYGKTAFPSKEEDLVKLREYRGLARLTSQLEDATKGQAPKRTGLQRDKPSERIRTLQKQVKEMMQRMGIKDVSDEQRLRSSLDAVKTRLRNEIEELEAAIRNRQPRPEGKSQVEYDAEAKALKEQRDAVREQYDRVFGKRQQTDADRIAAAKRLLERRIEEVEKLIAEGKAKRDRESKAPVTSPEIEALRAKLGGLNEQRNALRDREAERLERIKKLTKTQTEKIRQRIAKGDYEPAAKLPPVKVDEELGKLRKENIDAKREFNEKLLDARLAARSGGAKVWDTVKDVFNASRSIITSGDVSAVLRQGGFLVFGNPLRALKAIGPMFKAGFSKEYAEGLAAAIESNPEFVRATRAGLFLSEFGDSHHFSKMEEAFRGRLAKQIPGVKHIVNFSERTYTAFLNKLRMDTFEAMSKSVSSSGDLTDAEAKVIANFINVATGRGNLERFDKAAEALSTAFFSPKYVVSRFQLLAMPLTGFRSGYGASARTRKAIAKEYGKTLIGASLVYGLAAFAAAMRDDDEVTIEADPRSSDFGKIKIGNTRIDPMFGLLQTTTLISRLATGEKKRTTDGEIVALRGEDAGFGQSPAGVIGQFMRTKLAPIPSTIINTIDGEDVVGNKVFWETELAGNLMPLTVGDLYANMKEQGVPAGTALSILTLFGSGVSTYGNDDIKPLEQDIMTGIFQVDPERYED